MTTYSIQLSFIYFFRSLPFDLRPDHCSRNYQAFFLLGKLRFFEHTAQLRFLISSMH
jgi:hypothetical protein